MPVDLSRPLKAAIIDHLAADTAVLALVPGARIFAMTPPAEPAWPFIRYGTPVTSPYEATCWDGSTVRVTLHAFAETTADDAGEDKALDMAAAIVAAMETFAPADMGVVECEWEGTQCIRDSNEADQWHSWCEFRVTVEQ